jgi:hypothetical protein
MWWMIVENASKAVRREGSEAKWSVMSGKGCPISAMSDVMERRERKNRAEDLDGW